MGLLVDGEWHDQWYDTKSTGGRFIRSDAQYRSWVTKDGSAGPTGVEGFKAEAGRYHLYVSLACPWAHRTLIMRKMKGLEDMISVSVVNWQMFEKGWTFEPAPGVIPDPVNSASYMHQVRQTLRFGGVVFISDFCIRSIPSTTRNTADASLFLSSSTRRFGSCINYHDTGTLLDREPRHVSMFSNFQIVPNITARGRRHARSSATRARRSSACSLRCACTPPSPCLHAARACFEMGVTYTSEFRDRDEYDPDNGTSRRA
jgi:hypothetical protein